MPEEISIEDFLKVDMRVAQVKSVHPHPNADKLYIVKLDVGATGEKQTCAALKPYYSPDELVGKKVAIVLNLAPAKMRGELSETMMLACQDGDLVALLTPEKDLAPGSKVV